MHCYIILCVFAQAAMVFQDVEGFSLDQLNQERTKRGIWGPSPVLPTTPPPPLTKRDVLFVLDESVGYTNFQKFVKFASSLVGAMCGDIAVRKDKTRLGAVSFGSRVTGTIYFNQYNDGNSFIEALKIIRPWFPSPLSPTACIADTLRYALNNMFTRSRGARVGESDVRGRIILLTQGCDRCNPSALKGVASELENHGISITVFSVGSDPQCLNHVADLVDSSSRFNYRTWAALDDMSLQITRQPCTTVWKVDPPKSPYRDGAGSRSLELTIEVPWSEWGECSSTCGIGIQSRLRQTCRPTPILSCMDTRDWRSCIVKECPEMCTGEWTVWFDRDDPNGAGDYEGLTDLRKEKKLDVCISPSAIDGRVVSVHTNWNETGDILSVSSSSGLFCININQADGNQCKDYEVRFCCPKIKYRKEIKVLATTFLETITTTSERSPKSSNSGSKCTRRSYKGSARNPMMIGWNCPSIIRREKRQSCPIKRDVLFLIDQSGSVGVTNFKNFVRMTKAIIENFCEDIDIGVDKTRVGVFSFDSNHYDHIYFTETNKETILGKLQQLSERDIRGSRTCLVKALTYIKDRIFTKDASKRIGGARIDDPNTDQVIILISDGCANCEPESTRLNQLKSLKNHFKDNMNIVIYTYLVHTSQSCMDQMANLNSGSACYETFKLDSWEQTNLFIDELEKAAASNCRDSWHKPALCPEKVV